MNIRQIRRLNEELNGLLESNSDGSRILFDSFGGSIESYGDVLPYGKHVIRIGLGSSSRGKIEFEKPVEINIANEDSDAREAEFEAEYNRVNMENIKDIKEISVELKPLCDEFDQKIEAVLASKGYKRV